MNALVTVSIQENPPQAARGPSRSAGNGGAVTLSFPLFLGDTTLSQLALGGLTRSFAAGLDGNPGSVPKPRESVTDGLREPAHTAASVSERRPQEIADLVRRDPDAAVADPPRERPDPPIAPPAAPPAEAASPASRVSPAQTAPPSGGNQAHQADQARLAPPSPATAAQARTSAAPRPLTAQVTQDTPNLVAQPSTALTARTAVVAQAHASTNNSTNAPVLDPSTEAATPVTGAALQGAQGRSPAKKGVLRHPGQSVPGGQFPTSAVQPGAQGTLTALAVAPAAASATLIANLARGVQSGALPTMPAAAGAGVFADQTMGSTIHRPPVPMAAGRTQMPPRANTVGNQIAIQIQKAVGDGLDQVRIQLKPANLGRVDVKLELAPDGRVTAVISVEKPETLDLLQRDARGLQTALQDAGLRADSDSLSFGLKGHARQYDDGPDATADNAEAGDAGKPDTAIAAPDRSGDGRIDIEV